MALGTYMRGFLLWGWPLPIRYGHMVHAHSHIAYFGWGGLGLMGAAYGIIPALTGQPLAGGVWLRLQLWLAPLSVAGAFTTFALYGYAGPSIAFSFLNELAWYLFAWILWLNVRTIPRSRWQTTLILLVGATLQLLLSTLGTWLLMLDALIGTESGVLRDAGMFLFLHAYGDGWLVMGAMALLASLCARPGGQGLPARPVWWLVGAHLLAIVGFLRYLNPGALAPWLSLAGKSGGVLRASAEVAFLLVAVRCAWSLIAPRWRSPIWGFAALALGFLGAKAMLEFVPLLPVWPAWLRNRQLLLADLHLKLLGVFSAALLGWLAAQVAPHQRHGRIVVGLYGAGSLIMVLALGGAGLFNPHPLWIRAWFGLAFLSAVAVLVAAGAAVGAFLKWKGAWQRPQ